MEKNLEQRGRIFSSHHPAACLARHLCALWKVLQRGRGPRVGLLSWWPRWGDIHRPFAVAGMQCLPPWDCEQSAEAQRKWPGAGCRQKDV